MKPTTISFKRTKPIWFNLSIFLLLTSFLQFFPSCQKLDSNLLIKGTSQGINVISNAILPASSSILYWGHETFTIISKKNLEQTLKIENKSFDSFKNNFVLKVKNGSDKKTQVTKLEISIDGTVIINTSDFGKNTTIVSKQLCRLTPKSTLRVKLEGVQGSFIDLWIEGTLKVPVSVTDIEGNVYKTVVIGTQVWMAENLKVTKFNDGTPIPLITDQVQWAGLSTPGYCWMNNDLVTYGATYGALYNGYVVDINSNGGKNVCPTGWHVPGDSEWTVLTDYLGGESVAGGKMKEAGTIHWDAPNTGATNESGFTALPASSRSYPSDGGFGTIGFSAIWWSSTDYPDPLNAWSRYIFATDSKITAFYYFKTNGYSIRCLKDN